MINYDCKIKFRFEAKNLIEECKAKGGVAVKYRDGNFFGDWCIANVGDKKAIYLLTDNGTDLDVKYYPRREGTPKRVVNLAIRVGAIKIPKRPLNYLRVQTLLEIILSKTNNELFMYGLRLVFVERIKDRIKVFGKSHLLKITDVDDDFNKTESTDFSKCLSIKTLVSPTTKMKVFIVAVEIVKKTLVFHVIGEDGKTYNIYPEMVRIEDLEFLSTTIL